MDFKFKDETVPMGGTVLKERPYTNEPGDEHLRLVLVKTDREYVTWMHNMSSGGYHHGHYTQDLEVAKKSFNERGL